MNQGQSERDIEQQVAFGECVYDADGNELGRVRQIADDGFYVTTTDGTEALSVGHQADSMGGQKELLWRCLECGAVGELSEIPEECTDCGAPKEEIYYWQED
jgi:rubrerythrin